MSEWDARMRAHQQEALAALAVEPRRQRAFRITIVWWLLDEGYATKVEGDGSADFGLVITEKGRKANRKAGRHV